MSYNYPMKNGTIITLGALLFFSCQSGKAEAPPPSTDYREEMRHLVTEISRYAREFRPGFIIVPQNGQELILDGDSSYINSLDGTGREDLNYGYRRDNRPTPEDDRQYLLSLCRRFAGKGKAVLVTDYCRDREKADRSYLTNRREGFLSFAAPERNLTVIPTYPPVPREVNNRDISSLDEASNFLYLISEEDCDDREAFLNQIGNTDYDVLILDLFFQDREWTAEEIQSLKEKKHGGRRLVLAYMSIGEAENYRWYWNEKWAENPPVWLEEENPFWKGNFKVRYWEEEWGRILMGAPDSYLDKILAARFDGAYLDIIDGFEYFENR